ncbi:hypothetical protein MNBD_ACTINO02-408, partial [hydrothermal vent metagenome]
MFNSEVRVGVGVDLTDGFFCVPRHAYFSVGVASFEETDEFRATFLGEPFIGFGQQAADPIQRIVFTAAVSHCFVLDPAAAFIKFGVGEFHDMERVSDLGS